MPCPHDSLPLLATGRLSGFAKWRMARHVKSCPDCTAELAQLSSLSGQLRVLTLSEPSADLDERVLTFRPERITNENRGYITTSCGENPVRIPVSVFVGVGIGSSLAMFVTLFQAPVYEASGKALVKTPGALTRMVALANRGIPKDVMERLQREKSRVFVPEVRVEPIEKTPFLRFHATADDPDLVAQAVNETLRETILAGEKNGIRVSVIDEAIVPSQPIGPNRSLNLVLGAGLGGLLGMCFGILRRR